MTIQWTSKNVHDTGRRTGRSTQNHDMCTPTYDIRMCVQRNSATKQGAFDCRHKYSKILIYIPICRRPTGGLVPCGGFVDSPAEASLWPWCPALERSRGCNCSGATLESDEWRIDVSWTNVVDSVIVWTMHFWTNYSINDIMLDGDVVVDAWTTFSGHLRT